MGPWKDTAQPRYFRFRRPAWARPARFALGIFAPARQGIRPVHNTKGSQIRREVRRVTGTREKWLSLGVERKITAE